MINSPGLGYYYPTLYTLLAADPTSTYYLGCLLGTFADATGRIVGQPFFIGDGPTSVTVPFGATRLQLGINDDLFGDNRRGIVRCQSPGPTTSSAPASVPLPATSLLFGSGLLGLVGLKAKISWLSVYQVFRKAGLSGILTLPFCFDLPGQAGDDFYLNK